MRRTHESRDAAAEQWRAEHPDGIVIGTFSDGSRTKAVVIDVHRVFLNAYIRDLNPDGSQRQPGYVLHRAGIAPLTRLLQDVGLVLDHEIASLDHLADQLAEQP